MSNNKPLNKHFKKAQQIVELALVLPFFIICFSFVFQLMVETYAKYKFSYIFANSVARAVDLQTVYKDRGEASVFDFKRDVKNATIAAALNVPHQGIEISDFLFDGVNNYLAGVFITDVDRLFFTRTGVEYFYFIIPINRIYFEPLIVNMTNTDLDEYFEDWYYAVFREVYSDPGGGPPVP